MKKLWCFLMTALLLATGVFAEGGAEQASGKKTVTWWALSAGGGEGDDIREAFRKKVIAAYEAANPNVKIELTILDVEAFKQKIQVAMPAGDGPDIFHSWGGGVLVEFAKAGLLQDISDYAKKNFSPVIGAGALEVYSYAGKYYGAPYDLGAVGMLYNKAIFKKLGISVPQTWPQLLDAVKKIKAAGYIPIAAAGGDKWPCMYWYTYLAMRIGGKPAFDAAYGGKGSFKDPTFVKAGEMLLELAALEPFQPGFLSATYGEQAALMGDGKAAMELMGQWAPSVEAGNSANGKGIGSDLGWFAFPAVPGGAGKNTDVMGGGNGYAINKDAPKEALDFLKFFLSKEYNMELQKIEGTIPVVKGAEEALVGNEIALAISNAVSKAAYYQLYYDQFLPASVGQAINDASVALLARTTTPAEAAAAIDKAWQSEK